MVKNALKVLAYMNKERVEYPNFNEYISRKPDETKVQ
jgi:hypothetical protein